MSTGGAPGVAQRVVVLADLPVRLVAHDHARADAMTHLLGVLPEAGDPARLELRFAAGQPSLPSASPTATYGDIRLWRSGDALIVAEDAGAQARLEPGYAIYYAPDDRVHAGFRRIFHHVAAHLLAFEQRFVLHAAALACRERAVALLGGTGRGKSTLAYIGLEAGWSLLADDLVVLKTEGALQISGIPRPPAIPGALMKPAGTTASDARGRVELPASKLTQGWFRLAGTAFIEHAEAPDGHLQQAGGHDPVHGLISSFPAAGHPPFLRALLPLAAVAAKLPCWRLGLASDPGRRKPAATAHLDTFRAAILSGMSTIRP